MTQSFKPVHLTDEDAASVAALHASAEHAKQQGLHQIAWQDAMHACNIINRSTLQALTSGNFQSDEELMYCETPEDYAHASSGNKGLHLSLLLIADSPLAREMVEVLKKHEAMRYE